jgi:hypothetical protein
MKTSKTLVVISCLIALLALLAAGTGVLYRGEGASYEATSLRGEKVMIYGHGLYRYDPASMAAQGISQDIVTLIVGIPLLLISLRLYRQGRLRGQLLLSGTLAYFLYTYTSMAFGAAFNPLFLVYVAIFSLSLFAFIIAMLSVDVRALPAHFTEKLPRRAISIFMFAGGGFLLLAWLGRIVPGMSGGVPVGLLTNTTLFIQVMDLGLIVPLMALAGILLLRRAPLGYLLSSVALIKFMTMGIALVAMITGQLVDGDVVPMAEATIFIIMAIAGITMAFVLLRDLRDTAVPQAAGAASFAANAR